MDRARAARELAEDFLRAVNKYLALERHALSYGTGHEFYHAERHLLDLFYGHPSLNITELAELSGVSKGAISQAVTKLEKKNALKRKKPSHSSKEVIVELTPLGKRIVKEHRRTNEETVKSLLAHWRSMADTEVAGALSTMKWIEGHLEESRRLMAGE